MQTVKPDVLCSLKDVAAVMGNITVRTLYRLIAKGELVAVKVGRRTTIRQSSINDYIQRHEMERHR